MKRRPIKKELKRIVLLIIISALLLACVAGLGEMSWIRSLSRDSLIAQTKESLSAVVQDKSETVGLKLGHYANYISISADYIEKLYESPDSYIRKEVLPPDKANQGVYSMQMSLTDESINEKDISGELGLLGNLENIWAPFMAQDGDIITTIYFGTESGIMVSYDKDAGLSAAPDGGKIYYNYFYSSWYSEGRYSGKGIFFTQVYKDFYDRGLMVSCGSPCYCDGKFIGVVCMDILIEDLQSEAVDIGLSEGSKVYLTDSEGVIIAATDMDPAAAGSESITDSASPLYSVSKDVLSGEAGIQQTPDGTYCAYSPVGQAGWLLCAAVPEENILSRLNTIDTGFSKGQILYEIIFLAMLAAVSVLVSKFSDKLTKPVRCLQEDAKIIASGDLDHRAERMINDEIGDLAVSFNDMSDSLKKHISELTRVTAERERIGAELSIASHIQSSMLPCIFPPFPDRKEFDIYASMVPAKEVGGDFYDLFMVDDRHIAFLVADVSGKGVPAALFMVIGKTLIKDRTVPGADLGDVFSNVNKLLCESNSEGLFITAFECVLDLETGELRYVNAGHNPPLIRHNGGDFEYLQVKHGFVLAGLDGVKYRSGSLQFGLGDEIFLYTDGITEATNAENELYGEDRLKRCLNSAEYSSCKELLKAVETGTAEFVAEAPQFDDMTMLALKFAEKYNKE